MIALRVWREVRRSGIILVCCHIGYDVVVQCVEDSGGDDRRIIYERGDWSGEIYDLFIDQLIDSIRHTQTHVMRSTGFSASADFAAFPF